MNPPEQWRVFIRVAELASFTQAALSLGLPKAKVSTAVQQLENALGTRLLHRTTRKVQLSQDGQRFYERCIDLLAELDDLQSMFQQTGAQSLRGRVRVDMSTGLARHAVMPRLPELLRAHPLLEVELSCTERRVDLVREGFDCVLRAGQVVDAGLIGRPLGHLRMVNCASPAYLAQHGVPVDLADLSRHQLVHYVNTLGARSGGFDYLEAGQPRQLAMSGAVTVDNAEAYTSACLAGLGIIQVPVAGVRDWLVRGDLVVLLPEWTPAPMPLNLLYVSRRNLSRRVRLVMDWLAGVTQDYLSQRNAEPGGPATDNA
ncbi:LysR family transcriptional regulator [Hydrogenophaga sp.]|uniref:LysR family transcriptional regulator n=1 Tax=Hydrogenophaga sp. TaxID=1904254 RepID=UPI003566EE12